MTIKDFVKKAVEQDDRNVFEPCEKVVNVPEEFIDFYSEANPLDVELNFNGIMIRLFPFGELELIQQEYGFANGEFIFGDSNGDPVYYLKGKIYIGLHGSSKIDGELISESISAFFDMIN